MTDDTYIEDEDELDAPCIICGAAGPHDPGCPIGEGEHQFEVVLPDHARAEADTLGAALSAAHTLLDDAFPANGGPRRLARQSVIISRDGKYDPIATNLARAGHREALSAEWSRS